MQITKQADYAMRAVLYLAGLSAGKREATSRVAAKEKIPPSFLAKIVSQLSVAGLLETSRGARGGVSLARPAKEISVLDVVEAIDGPITFTACTGDGTACVCSEDCPMRAVWHDAQETVVKKLRSTNFQQLMNASKAAA